MRRSDEIQEQLDELIEDKHQLTVLIETIGWKRLEKIIDGQVKARRQVSEQPLASLLDVPAREFGLGEIAGMSFFKQFPTLHLDVLKNDIETLQKELNHAVQLEKEFDTGDATSGGKAP